LAQSDGNGPLWPRTPTTWRVHKGELSHEPLRNLSADGPVAVMALANRKGDAVRRSALASEVAGRYSRARATIDSLLQHDVRSQASRPATASFALVQLIASVHLQTLLQLWQVDVARRQHSA
jgi:hypothetical protein